MQMKPEKNASTCKKILRLQTMAAKQKSLPLIIEVGYKDYTSGDSAEKERPVHNVYSAVQ